MDHLIPRERDTEVDLESGETTSEDERTEDRALSNIQTKGTFSTFWNDLSTSDRVGKGECGMDPCSSSSGFGMVEVENLKFMVDKNLEGEKNHELMGLAEKNFPDEKSKKTNTRKPPKPPRPPKGPLLDAADQKLVREIAELATRKRARMKQIKAMKKTKAVKASSSSSSSSSTLSAMVITVIFCLVIFYQGICSRRGVNMMLEGSPAPAVGSSEGLISVQFYKSFTTTEEHDHDPPSLVEQQVSGSLGERN